MLAALYAMKDKLSFYCVKTDEVHDDVFAIGAILAPENKLILFQERIGIMIGARDIVKARKNIFEPYKLHLANTQHHYRTIIIRGHIVVVCGGWRRDVAV
jgi:hypothetical protein